MISKKRSLVKTLLCLVFLLFTTASPSYGAAITLEAPYVMLADYKTGVLLLKREIDASITPSSMTKIMTIYIAFKALKEGKINLSTQFPVSKKSWSMGGSKMYLGLGDMVKVEDLLRGIIVQSGNDACITLAEGMFSSEELFVDEMNAIAKKLDLTNSNFKNSSGWPQEGHVMSLRDLTKLSIALIKDFPEYYPYHSEKAFAYNNITQPNRNPLLGQNGVDGIKTGHTDAGGHGVVLSGTCAGGRVIGVLNGLKSVAARTQEATQLINYACTNFFEKTLFSKDNSIVEARVFYGQSDKVKLGVAEDLNMMLPKYEKTQNNKISVTFQNNITAPIVKGTKLGEITIQQETVFGDKMIFPLVAMESVEESSFLERISQNIAILFAKK